MAEVRVRARMPLTWLGKGQETSVERTPMVDALLQGGLLELVPVSRGPAGVVLAVDDPAPGPVLPPPPHEVPVAMVPPAKVAAKPRKPRAPRKKASGG